jgi:peptidoglycan/xylan/chitin deacetylase (PgdA/CDA1 family)
MTTGPVSILSFDLEDWSYLVMRMFGREPAGHAEEVVRQTHRALELLSRHAVKATFFVLGSTAASAPGLVRALAAEGHEIATHGYDHKPVGEGALAGLAEDVRRAKGGVGTDGRPVRG